MQAKRILVIGCGGSPGVNFIRALRLARKKFYIVGADINRYFLHISPVDKRYLLSGSETSVEHVSKIIKTIKKERIDFVHAQPDEEVKILSDYRDVLPARLFLPSKKAIDTFQDKWKTYVILNTENIPVPRTELVASRKDLVRILKRGNKTMWIRAKKGAGGKASLPVKTFEHAHMWISYWLERGLSWSDFIANEYLPGKEISFLSLWKNGRLICSQQKERMVWVQGDISPSGVGGTSAIQKTTSYQDVNEIATKTIQVVDKDANGVYVVDLKRNEKGIPCVMEVNPGRFFTTSLFFPTAGINFPYLFVKLGLGLAIPNISKYNVLPNGLFWIRVTDSNTGMAQEKEFEFEQP